MEGCQRLIKCIFLFLWLRFAEADPNNQGPIFRANPAGWTCGDAAFRTLRLPYSHESSDSLQRVLISEIVSQCQESCRVVPWCRAYSVGELPRLRTTVNYDNYDTEINSFVSSASLCKMYNTHSCKVVRWPQSDGTVMVYKIPQLEDYELMTGQKCGQRFESFIEGPPDACAQACNYSPTCSGFNYKFADNVCFLTNYNSTQDILNGRQQPACRQLVSDAIQFFYSRKTVELSNELNDPMPQFEGFFMHNGNCRGGVTANFEPVLASNNGIPQALAIYSCPSCNASVESCLATCRALFWCRGVSVFVGARLDFSKPLCFLKSSSCQASQIDTNAVYKFFERTN